MNITIQANHFDLNDSLKEYVEKRITTLEKYIDVNDESVQCSVDLERTTHHHQSGNIFQAEINIHISGQYFNATHESNDMHAAIDGVKEEVARELRDYKDKQKALEKKGNTKIKNMIKGFEDEE